VTEVTNILGRPFIATGKDLCAAEARELTFRVGDEKVIFHVCMSMRQPNSNEVCSLVDLVTDQGFIRPGISHCGATVLFVKRNIALCGCV